MTPNSQTINASPTPKQTAITIPYQTWGPAAQERSKRRLSYFSNYQKIRYMLKRKEIIDKSKKYYLLNREIILAALAKNYESNPEEAYYQLHRAEIAEYYQLHREEIRAKQAIYYQKKKTEKTDPGSCIGNL